MSAVLKQCATGAIALTVLLLAACSQSTTPSVSGTSEAATKSTGPPELATAKTAFWPMYRSARTWTTDLVTLRLAPKEVPGFKNEAGKAAMWEATFGSPGRHEYRVYSYAIATVPPDIRKGVAAGLRQPWGGLTRDAMPIELSSFNIDSDVAYKTAAGGAAVWMKKNPDKKLSSFELRNAYRFQTPVWYLMWGDKKSGYLAFVDANNGEALNKK
ncbi:MAG TPA: hypothetical protein VGM27_02555 [Acidobacteriaceae bacterium]|jgi:hypothetical protein